MTQKEKASEIFRKFYYAKDEDGYHSMSVYRAKQCGLIAIDYILLALDGNVSLFEGRDSGYWRKVKSEIEKL